MKYDLSIVMRAFNNVPFAQNIVEEDGSTTQKHMTLKDMLENALVNADPQEFNTGEKKLEIYKLLQKIHAANPDLNLSAEEVTTVKKVVGKNMTITAVGAIYEALESPRTNPLKVVVEAKE